jgi:hypothetical protein
LEGRKIFLNPINLVALVAAPRPKDQRPPYGFGGASEKRAKVIFS